MSGWFSNKNKNTSLETKDFSSNVFKIKSDVDEPTDFSELKNHELEDLKQYIHETESHLKAIISELTLKLEKTTDQNEILREEMREWVCSTCREVYYGGSSLILKQVSCPKCNKGHCIPRRIIKVRDLQEKINNLNSQIEFLIKNKAG